MESQQAVDDGIDCLDYQSQTQLVNKEMGFLDLSPFTIRKFVSTVRSKEFWKCWPFRRGILESCVSNGINPQLPPFDLPSRRRVKVSPEKQPVIADDTCLATVSKAKKSYRHSVSEERDKQKLVANETFMVSKASAEVPPTRVPPNAEVNHDVEAQFEGKELKAESSEAINKVDQPGTMADEGAASENPHVGKVKKAEKAGETGVETSPSLPHTNGINAVKDWDNHGGSRPDVSGHLQASCYESEDITSTTVHPDSNEQTLNQPNPKFDTVEVVQADSNFKSDAATKIEIQAENSGDRRLFFERVVSTQVQGQKLAQTQSLETMQFSTCIKSCGTTDGTKQETSGVATTPSTEADIKGHQNKQETSRVATAPSIKGDILGHQNRMETVKDSKDFGVTGINSDSLSAQLCPVCVNFTSSSNTALNAHIDHCLATVVPNKKTEVRQQKNIIKVRKKRSMVEICAVAPSRTLEDLEMSRHRWAVIEETNTGKAVCSLDWTDVTVQRRPRTHLHRGPTGAWKGKSKVHGETGLQQTLCCGAENCHYLENARRKYPVQKNASRHAKLGISHSSSTNTSKKFDLELQESCRDQQSHGGIPFLPGPLRPMHGGSFLHTGKWFSRHNQLKHNLGSLKVAEGSEFAGNASVSLSLHKSMEEVQAVEVVNPFSLSKTIESLCDRSDHHDSDVGSSPSYSSLERAIQQQYHCPEGFIDKGSNGLGTAVPQQLVSLVAKDKTSLESSLTQNGESVEFLDEDEGFISTTKRIKKNKKGIFNQIAAQNIPRQSRFTSLLGQDPSDRVWLDLFSRHGIVPVDTSAEEANRLLNGHGVSRFTQGQQWELGDTKDGHSKITDISKSVIAPEVHFEEYSPENREALKSLKKHKFSQLELENSENIAITIADKQVALENKFELSVKSKKLACESKTIVNITPVRNDNDERLTLQDGCGTLPVEKEACVNECPKVTSNGEACLKRTPVDGSCSHQIKMFKRKRMTTTRGDTIREAFGRDKHASLHIAKLQRLSCNLGLSHATEQSKSPEGSLVASNGVLTECRRQGGVGCDSTNASSVAGENPPKENGFENMTKELRSPKTNTGISSQIYSKDLSEDKNPKFLLKQMKNIPESVNELNKLVDTFQSDASPVQKGAADLTKNCESSKRAMPVVNIAETHMTRMTETGKGTVNSMSLQEQTETLSPALSVTSLSDAAVHKFSSRTSSCRTSTTITSLGFVGGTCSRIVNSFTRLESCGSNDLPFVQPTDSIRTMHASHCYTADKEAPMHAAPAAGFKKCTSSTSFSSPDLSDSTSLVGIRNCNLHMISSLRGEKNPDSLKCELSVQQLTPQVQFCDESAVMAYRHLQNTPEVASPTDRSDLFVSNNTEEKSREIHLREGMEKVESAANGRVDANDFTGQVQNIQEMLGPEKSDSRMQSMISAPVPSQNSLPENGKLVHDVAMLGDTQRLAFSSQKLSFPSDLLADLAKTIADGSKDSQGARDTPSNISTFESPVELNIKQRSSNMSLKFTPDAHEQMNLMAPQNICCYNTERSGGSIGPQILQSAMHLLNGKTSTSAGNLTDFIPESVNRNGGLLTLPLNQPIHGQVFSAEMNGRRRENLSGAELTSSLNGYVDCPGEQGVVYIFGNPVFKLMGKNVMVTNKNVKSLGIENTIIESGSQCLNKPTSVQWTECMETAEDLGLFQDIQNRFSEPVLEARVFEHENTSCCQQGDVCKPRNHPVGMDNLVIHSHATQNLSLPAFGNIECYRHGSAAALELKRQAVVKSAYQTQADVIAQNVFSQGSGNSMCNHPCKGATQQNCKPWFEYPFSSFMDEPQLRGQGHTLAFGESPNVLAHFLVNLKKLGLTAATNFHWSNQQSGSRVYIGAKTGCGAHSLDRCSKHN